MSQELTISEQRKINVVNTGGKNFVHTTSAQTLGQLLEELKHKGVDRHGKKMIIGENRHTLEVDEAVLPKSNFTFFLLPAQTKSGASEVRARIKEIIGHFPVEGKAHFSADKSYTNKKEAELVTLLDSWVTPKVAAALAEMDKMPKEKKVVTGRTAITPKDKTKTGNVADIVQNVKEFTEKEIKGAKETNGDNHIEMMLQSIDKKLDIIISHINTPAPVLKEPERLPFNDELGQEITDVNEATMDIKREFRGLVR